MWPLGFRLRASMTSPRLDRLLLMFCVSRMRSPSAPLCLSRSDPARATRLSVPSQRSFVAEFSPASRRMKTECDRDDRSLALVAATDRLLCACRSMASTLSAESRLTVLQLTTRVVLRCSSCLISSLGLASESLSDDDDDSKSLSTSLYTSTKLPSIV